MKRSTPRPFFRFLALIRGVFRAPLDMRRLSFALLYGAICHVTFALAVMAMMIAMFHGMSASFGRLSAPWAYLVNGLLIMQFPLVHSLLLTRPGHHILSKMAPSPFGNALTTTSYAIVAAIQLLMLFTLWSPSGIVWWHATGLSYVVLCCLYAGSWLLLIWASYDAGAEVQSGALGWMSLAQNTKPVFPQMPTRGLFSIVRQPIYVAFAMTTWTVPVWTPDQLFLATTLTAYCLLAPRLKERRFAKRYGPRFEAYKRCVNYAVPRFGKHR